MISLWNSTKSKAASLFGLTLFCAGFMFGSAQADEVSTKIVGFVKAPMGPGTYFYSIPFQDVGEIDETQLHFLNIDNDNDSVLDTFSPGLFSDENFSTGDSIRKLDKTTGRYGTAIIFRDTLFPGQPTRTGWCSQFPGTPFWVLSDESFQTGEGFLVEYSAGHAPGEELFFLGQVNEYEVEIPITAGYNLVGNPYPSAVSIADAFVEDPDNSSVNNMTAATGSYAPAQDGDFIRTGYDPATTAWNTTAYYWDNTTTGKGWYYQKPGLPFWFPVPTDPSNPDYDKFLLEPTKGYLYYAQNAFIWKVESPVSE